MILSAVAIAAFALFIFAIAPASDRLNGGSSYNRDPDGYGAWYAFMAGRKSTLERWQKPLDDLPSKSPATLIRVYPQLRNSELSAAEKDWVESGNTLIILGVIKPVTSARFITRQNTSFGGVEIATRRRAKSTVERPELLGDEFGAIVWETAINGGRAIFATAPYLAANAYQDAPGNFQFLAGLADNPSIFIDEYIHGYRDLDPNQSEGTLTLFDYLIDTPLFPAFLQGAIVFMLWVWAANRRFGRVQKLPSKTVDNSIAYIDALAGVLRRANSSEFVLDVVGKEEKKQLLKALGLGDISLDDRTLIDAFAEATGESPQELRQVLQTQNRRQIGEANLLKWLQRWRSLRK
ncbi:MAG: DUF4350 domain-containing protein [Limnospira sp.]